MHYIYTFILLFTLSTLQLFAQEYSQISVGAYYSQQAFYNISDGSSTLLDNESWDIAFTTGFAEAGILYNESTALSADNSLELFYVPDTDFNTVIEPASLIDTLYNKEQTWQDGAFNTVKDINNPFDYGWGVYNPSNHVVSGIHTYVIKLRNGNFKKIKIESLEGGVYNFKHADLDGANETQVSINKADHAASPFALFSFDSNSVTTGPTNWDLMFARYVKPLSAGGTSIIHYPVTGVLSAPNVEVAEARNVNPDNVDANQYLDSLKSDIEVIGSDWKFFDLDNFSWTIDNQRAYFVKLLDNHLWKLVFIDFEGSSTGVTSIQKTDLGLFTSVDTPESIFKDFGVFPNCLGANENFTASFTLLEYTPNMELSIVNTLGQKVWSQNVTANASLNVFSIDMPNIPTGVYQFVASSNNDLMTSKIMVK